MRTYFLRQMTATVASGALVLSVLLPLQASAEVTGDSCPLRREIGQLFVVEPPNNDISSRAMKEFKAHLLENNIGGVTLFDWNLPKVDKKKDLTRDPVEGTRIANQIIDYVNALQDGQDPGLFVSIDQEGGLVQRLNTSRGFTQLPSLKRQADAGDPVAIRKMAEASSRELKAVGVNWNFAPVLDIGTDAQSEAISRNKRALSSDAEITGKYGSEIVTGMQENGIIATAKHFPGHGAVAGDSHAGPVHLDKAWEEITKNELLPFIHAINRDVGSIMVGHIIVDDLKSAPGAGVCAECLGLPASLNPFLMQRLLRQEYGFKGLIVTDDMSMQAITQSFDIEEAVEKAILAGADSIITRKGQERKVIPYLCKRSQEKTAAGKLLAERIQESYARILETKDRFKIRSPRKIETLVTPVSSDQNRETSKAIVESSDRIYQITPERRDSYGDPVKTPKAKPAQPISEGLHDLLSN